MEFTIFILLCGILGFLVIDAFTSLANLNVQKTILDELERIRQELKRLRTRK